MTDCYLCSSKRTRSIRDRLRHGIRRNVLSCDECGLNFLEPRQDDLRQFYGTEYRKVYSPRTDEISESRSIFEIYRPFQEERVARLRPHLPQQGTLLDIGCSAGHFLDAVRPYVGECLGIELNLANAAFVREELKIPTYTTPIEETDLPEDQMDFITCFHAMEHMPDPRAFLESLKPYLRRGGRLYIEVPNVDDALLSVYFNEAYADFWYREPHLFNFSPTTLSMLMEQAGYDGRIVPVQRYSLMNHLNWQLARQPQGGPREAMSPGVLADDERGPLDVREQLNTWFARIDAEYRELLRNAWMCESIGFLAEVV